MSVVRHEGRLQITCDGCPASYPNTYEETDFKVMVEDIKAAGWSVRKLPPDVGNDRFTTDLFGRAPRIAGSSRPQAYTHKCPDCRRVEERGSLL